MSDLNLYPVDGKKFRSIFYSIQLCNVVLSIATFFIISNTAIFPPVAINRNTTQIVMFIMIGLAVIFTTYQKKRIRQIVDMKEFESKVAVYEKFYRFRMFWHLLSCIVACVLGILSGRIIFFYFALFEVLIAFPYYPSSLLLRRELKNEEIIIS